MKEIIKNLPYRDPKPREKGLTMIMDKGLSIRQAEDLLSLNHEFIDIIKLGFGTSILTPNISQKIKIYQKNGIIVYPGGTLFEVFAVRNQIEEYKKYLDKIGVDTLEISDGSMNIKHEEKCTLIKDFSKNFTVLSEVGSKNENIELNEDLWINYINNEIDAGSWKVITEAREGGNIGIFQSDCSINENLINNISKNIKPSKILWEAPQKDQQVWFINNFGSNVNLGNISPNEILSLECLRLGLRGDTFSNYL